MCLNSLYQERVEYYKSEDLILEDDVKSNLIAEGRLQLCYVGDDILRVLDLIYFQGYRDVKKIMMACSGRASPAMIQEELEIIANREESC